MTRGCIWTVFKSIAVTVPGVAVCLQKLLKEKNIPIWDILVKVDFLWNGIMLGSSSTGNQLIFHIPRSENDRSKDMDTFLTLLF